MGFIREYMDQSGDPFLKRRMFRLPKRIRKFQPGRALRAALPAVAGFVPGAGMALDLARGLGYEAGDEDMDPTELAFARMYGYEAGDPGKSSKRKAAAAGPKAKAKAKKNKRAAKAGKAAAHASGAKSKGKGISKKHLDMLKKAGGIGAQILLGAGKDVPGLGGAISAAQDMGYLGGAPGLDATPIAVPAGMGAPGAFHIPGMHRKRHTMNPANVKALRRSIRRLEGFEKLVKHVERAFPRLKRAHHGAPAAPHRKGKR